MPYPFSVGDPVNANDINEIAAGIITQIVEAGEAIDGSSTPQPVCVLSDLEQVQIDELTNNAHIAFGRSGDQQRRAVKIRVNENITSSAIKSYLRDKGSGATHRIVIEGDSGGSPDGSAITNGTSDNKSALGETENWTYVTYAFSTPFTLVADTDYWIIWEMTGADSDTNYQQVPSFGTNYASFVAKDYNGAAWVDTELPYFELIPDAAGGSSQSAFKTDGNIGVMSILAGFVKDNVSAGATIDVLKIGTISGFSDLIGGQDYYIGNTAGAITLMDSMGASGALCGVAISDTVLEIKRGKVYLGSLTIETRTGASNTSTISRTIPLHPKATFAISRATARNSHVNIIGTINIGQFFPRGLTSTSNENRDDVGSDNGIITSSWNLAGHTIGNTASLDAIPSEEPIVAGTIYFYRDI